MTAAMEGRSNRDSLRFSFKKAIGWALLLLVFLFAMGSYKKAMLGRMVDQGLQASKTRTQKVINLFQASFFFAYQEQFLPGIKQVLAETGKGPKIKELLILSEKGNILFNSSHPPTLAQNSSPDVVYGNVESEVKTRLSMQEPSVFVRGFEVRVLVPWAGYWVLYTLDGSPIRNLITFVFLFCILFTITIGLLKSRGILRSVGLQLKAFWERFFRLRVKFLAAIFLINMIAASIIFYSLSSLQTQEQTRRIEKESILFSEFSTSRVISDFTNYFYFYYLDRFLPELKRTIASNENLVAIRIISRRTGSVLFDSEQAATSPNPTQMGEAMKVDYSEDFQEQLKTQDLATRYFTREGEKLISITSTYRNENQEAMFWVEYLFSFHSLARSIRAIREQILVDLVPSLALGLLIAGIFAQLLISPIRRLVSALQRVTGGDYNVSVDLKTGDEVGDLVQAFNTMTSELKKKHELRKYLSDSTYRQVMSAMESPEGIKIGGSRVAATVLFSDIRDFVSHCESLDAEEVTAMLNEYFSAMVDVVYKHGGEVDKFIGDALLAVFYCSDETRTIRPVDTIHGTVTPTATALQAIYCALEMREKLAEFNEKRRNAQKAMIEIGVGISHGEIISGPIGAKDRMDFTVIGDVVNLSNRIEKLSKGGKYTKILFSHHVEEKVRGLLDYEELNNGKIRGKKEEVRVFELIGVRDLDALIKNLEGSDVFMKRRSIELLGQSRNTNALPMILRCLSDPDETSRLSAALALVKLAPMDHDETLNALMKLLSREVSEKVLSAAITAAGKLCSTDRILELIPFLDSPNDRIVANAVESIGQVRTSKCMDLILPKLNSRSNRVKANAAMALFAAGHAEVIDTLKPMLMHSDPLMRSSAAFAIGELTLIAEKDYLVRQWRDQPQATKYFLAELQESVPMLVVLLKDPDLMVKRQAIVALGKIRDKSAVLPMIDLVDSTGGSAEIRNDILEALRSIGSHKLIRELIGKLS